ncbi:MAG: cytochrome c oxidase assembly protein [Caedibacter sp. 37-49]|nr:MAG: cytochrome c oxidase assembly protein [Caedibacter sp. 37-49]
MVIKAVLTRNQRTLLFLLALLLMMTILAFASVPLYRLFCQKTGYGGTPRIALSGTDRIIDHSLTIHFNADINASLPWKFNPLQSKITVKAGALGLAYYKVRNMSDEPLVGIAVYNVTPDKAAPYFNKIECFCFEEQRLEPHQTLELPVQFYIDPKIAEDPHCKDLTAITLSYTFFTAKDPKLPEILGLPRFKKK